MRFGLSATVLSVASSFSLAVLAAPPNVPVVPDPRRRASEEVAKSTIFNGQDVPPQVDLSGTTYKEDISQGYWIVKAFSPYCGHCQRLAPKWQTLYEFYYTSDVAEESQSTDPSSFSQFYNLTFAQLNCVAFGTACSNVNVNSFPTIIFFKDGVEVSRNEGDSSMSALSKFVEESLETIKPGSRPEDGPKLPKKGSHGDPALAKGRSASSSQSGGTGSSSNAQGGRQGSFAKSGQSEGKYKVAPIVPLRPSGHANPDGISVDLTEENFDSKVSKTLDAWLVKFYAPWCPHCQAMASSWKTMAGEMKGKLDVGEINCDVQKHLCRRMGVEAYPQIVLMRGPDRIPYDGLRGLGDLVDYATRAALSLQEVPEVSNAQFEQLEKDQEVLFLYLYDVATTGEDFQALERMPFHLINRAKLVKTADSELAKRFKVHTWPTLLVVREGQTDIYPGLAPSEMRNVTTIADWASQVWLPVVPELTAANAQEIMDSKFVVLGLLTRERDDEFRLAKREMKSAAVEWMQKEQRAFEIQRQDLRDAKQLRIDEAQDRNDERRLLEAKSIRVNAEELRPKGVRFAWVDGVFWERWIRTTFGINPQDGNRVVVNDYENHLYWDQTSTGSPIVPSRASILDTLPKIVTSPPKLAPKVSGSSLSYIWYKGKHVLRHYTSTVLVSFTVAVIVLIFCRRPLRRLVASLLGGSGGAYKRGGRHVSHGTARFLSASEKGERGESGGVFSGAGAAGYYHGHNGSNGGAGGAGAKAD